MPKKYLYGASVQSIQNFIFETGKLKEIVGGSELIEQIAERDFPDLVNNLGKHDPDNQILKAAGKIIYRFNEDELSLCQAVVKSFPRSIKEKAPFIQMSQAVVAIEGDGSKAALNKLEDLLDGQRNRSSTQHGQSLMITERARRTGRAGYKQDKNATQKGALIDRTQDSKLKAFNNNSLKDKILPQNERHRRLANDIAEIVPEKGWLAIVHADGNSLGKRIQTILKKVKTGTIGFYQRFSELLDEATVEAAQLAYTESVKSKIKETETVPLRPVLLGGDDLTLIIRGDLALDFTTKFLQFFQEKTTEKFQEFQSNPEWSTLKLDKGLTACAGIAFIKPNYPFHYGVSLSEELTKYAKRAAKKIGDTPPSCLAFHKVQSSFIGDYKEIIKRELTAKAADIQFNHGPYFLTAQPNHATVQELKDWVSFLKKADAPRTNLREWLTELQTNKAGAAQLLERIISIHPRFRKELNQEQVIISRGTIKSTPIFDALTIESIAKK